MARRYLRYLVTAAGLLAAAVFTLVQLGTPEVPSLKATTGAPEISQRFRLYSGELDPNTGALTSQLQSSVEMLGFDGVPARSFVQERDQSTDDLQLKPDGVQIARSESYYPEAPDDPGRHPHVIRVYAPTSDTVIDEQIFRFSGTLAEHTVADENGGKHILGYGHDGQTVIREVTINPRDFPWNDPVLQKEEHWREGSGHKLSFRNTINPDKTHTLTDWDAQGRTLKVMHMPEYGVSGATAVAYYPGTNKLRLDAKADYNAMTARYLRLNGTLDHIIKLSPSVTLIQYFDPSGTKITLEQTWWRDEKVVNGVSKFKYRIYTLSEMDDQGEDIRDIGYEDGALEYIWVHNAQVKGTDYAEADYNFDQTKGFMARASYWKTMGHQADIDEIHTEAENIRPPVIPPIDLKMAVDPDEDNLPIPPPQQGYPG
jgi:hypothetical protein